MNSLLAVTDAGNYAGIPSEYTSEAILAYVMSIESRDASTPWLTWGEEFGELRAQVAAELGL